MTRLAIIGGDAAGMSAATQARRVDPRLEIVVFQQGRYVADAACGLPFFIAGQVPRVEALILYPPEHFRQERGIDVRVRHQVQRIDLRARVLEGTDHEAGRTFREPFDRLVIATGGSADRPALPGADLQGLFTLRTPEDGLALNAYLEAGEARRAAVVGGGYIGLELAEALRHRGLEVSLFEALPQVLPMVDGDLAGRVADAARAAGVRLHFGTAVTAFEGAPGGRVRAVCGGGERHPAELVVLATGTRPNVALAAAAGVPLGHTGAISVDRKLHTGLFGVYAAGDCAEATHCLTGRPVYLPQGTTANRQGHVAGGNAAGASLCFPGILGTLATKVFGLEVARTGLSEQEARDAGFAAVAARAQAPSRSRYFPGAGRIDVLLVGDRRSGRLLGAQMVGAEGVAKRLDVLAAALHAGMTVEQVVAMDLTYAPPVAPATDPVIVAARALLKAMR